MHRIWATRPAVVLVAVAMLGVAACSGGGGAGPGPAGGDLQSVALARSDLEGPLAVSVRSPEDAARDWAVMTGQDAAVAGVAAAWPCSGLQPVALPALDDGAPVSLVEAQSPDGWMMRQWLVLPADPDAYQQGWRAALESCAASLPARGTGLGGGSGAGTFTSVSLPEGLGAGPLAYRRAFGTDDPIPSDYVLVRTGDVVGVYDRYCYQCREPLPAPAGRLDDRFAAFVEAGAAKVAAEVA